MKLHSATFLLLLYLKLTHQIEYDWWVITSPLTVTLIVLHIQKLIIRFQAYRKSKSKS